MTDALATTSTTELAPPPKPVLERDDKGVFRLVSPKAASYATVRASATFKDRAQIVDVVVPSNNKRWRILSLTIGGNTLLPDTTHGVHCEQLWPGVDGRPQFSMDVPAGAELAFEVRYMGSWPPDSRLELELHSAQRAQVPVLAQPQPQIKTGSLFKLGPEKAESGKQVHLKGKALDTCRIEALVPSECVHHDAWAFVELRVAGLPCMTRVDGAPLLYLHPDNPRRELGIVVPKGADVELVLQFNGVRESGDAVTDSIAIELVGKKVA